MANITLIKNGIDISNQVLHEKAIAFASLYEVENFKERETASAPLNKFDEFRKNLQDLICNYSLEDVFNCNKTGLYWKMESKRTISNKPNIIGIQQLAWMQVSIWNDWIRKFNVQIRLKGRNILLLIDNAPVHILYEGVELTNIKIEFLLLNTTAHLQPYDKSTILKIASSKSYQSF
ncbi:unnamed protein product [Rhizophagus irregularis]|nr:unnamed protein product [Rhizophagus irregularis]